MSVEAKKPEYEPTVLAGFAYYAFVHSPQPDKEYGDRYKIDLVVEDEDGKPFIYKNPSNGEEINMVEKCLGLGLELKTTPNIPGRHVRVQSKAVMKSGATRPPIPTTDTDKNPLDKSVLIGNGSTVRVRALINNWKYGKKSGVTALLDRVIVDNLVPYVSKRGDDEFDFPHMRKSAQEKKVSATDEAENQASASSTDDVPFEE